MPTDEILNLLHQNLEYTKQVHEEVRLIKRKLLWWQIFGFVKLGLILIPLILAIFFAVPVIKQVLVSYNDILKTFGGSSESMKALQQLLGK